MFLTVPIDEYFDDYLGVIPRTAFRQEMAGIGLPIGLSSGDTSLNSVDSGGQL